jgi:predicted ATPase
MLQSINLRNFKSWRKLPSTGLGRVTGIFGANSAGKSSIIQSLLLLKQTAESPDRRQVLNLGDERSYVDLGSFNDMAYGHDSSSQVTIGFAWSNDKPVSFNLPSGFQYTGESISFATHIDRLPNGELHVKELEYSIDVASFRLFAGDGRSYGFQIPEAFDLKPGFSPRDDIGGPIKCYGFSDELRKSLLYGDILGELQTAFEALFARTYYLGPLRDRARRQYTWSGTTPNDMGSRGERVVDALIAARHRGSKNSPGDPRHKLSLEEQIAYWLRELGLIVSFRVEEIGKESNLYRVLVTHQRGGVETALTDVGFGVSQVLPVLTLLYYVEPGSIVFLEHPEIHLHPSVQARLADVVIDAARTQDIQVIVESHSEHFLRRLQRRVAEQWQGITDKDVQLYFVGESNGESSIRALELDEFGRIANWPAEFFGDPLEDLVAAEEAGIRRRMERRSS